MIAESNSRQHACDIAKSRAEQLKAAGVQLQRQQPEELLLGGSRMLDDACVSEYTSNFTDAFNL